MNNTMGSPFGGTLFLNKAVISGVTGQSAKTLSTTPAGTSAVMEYAIRGKAYSHAAMSTHAVPTTDINTGAAFVSVAANKGCVFVLALAANGDMVVAQGPIVGADEAGTFLAAPEFPVLSDAYAPFGYIVVKTISTNTGGFVFGSSNWDATGCTCTPVDVIMLPDRPQVS